MEEQGSKIFNNKEICYSNNSSNQTSVITKENKSNDDIYLNPLSTFFSSYINNRSSKFKILIFTYYLLDIICLTLEIIYNCNSDYLIVKSQSSSSVLSFCNKTDIEKTEYSYINNYTNKLLTLQFLSFIIKIGIISFLIILNYDISSQYSYNKLILYNNNNNNIFIFIYNKIINSILIINNRIYLFIKKIRRDSLTKLISLLIITELLIEDLLLSEEYEQYKDSKISNARENTVKSNFLYLNNNNIEKFFISFLMIFMIYYIYDVKIKKKYIIITYVLFSLSIILKYLYVKYYNYISIIPTLYLVIKVILTTLFALIIISIANININNKTISSLNNTNRDSSIVNNYYYENYIDICLTIKPNQLLSEFMILKRNKACDDFITSNDPSNKYSDRANNNNINYLFSMISKSMLNSNNTNINGNNNLFNKILLILCSNNNSNTKDNSRYINKTKKRSSYDSNNTSIKDTLDIIDTMKSGNSIFNEIGVYSYNLKKYKVYSFKNTEIKEIASNENINSSNNSNNYLDLIIKEVKENIENIDTQNINTYSNNNNSIYVNSNVGFNYFSKLIHDFKTPLLTIIAQLDTLNEKILDLMKKNSTTSVISSFNKVYYGNNNSSVRNKNSNFQMSFINKQEDILEISTSLKYLAQYMNYLILDIIQSNNSTNTYSNSNVNKNNVDYNDSNGKDEHYDGNKISNFKNDSRKSNENITLNPNVHDKKTYRDSNKIDNDDRSNSLLTNKSQITNNLFNINSKESDFQINKNTNSDTKSNNNNYIKKTQNNKELPSITTKTFNHTKTLLEEQIPLTKETFLFHFLILNSLIKNQNRTNQIKTYLLYDNQLEDFVIENSNKTKFNQILLNVISNSVKFTFSGVIVIACFRKKNKHVFEKEVKNIFSNQDNDESCCNVSNNIEVSGNEHLNENKNSSWLFNYNSNDDDKCKDNKNDNDVISNFSSNKSLFALSINNEDINRRRKNTMTKTHVINKARNDFNKETIIKDNEDNEDDEDENETGEQANILILDSGSGITTTFLESFINNKTVTNQNPSNPMGTGLGINIVKNLTKLLNIDFKIRTKLNKGSLFTFELNIKQKQSINNNNNNDKSYDINSNQSNNDQTKTVIKGVSFSKFNYINSKNKNFSYIDLYLNENQSDKIDLNNNSRISKQNYNREIKIITSNKSINNFNNYRKKSCFKTSKISNIKSEDSRDYIYTDKAKANVNYTSKDKYYISKSCLSDDFENGNKLIDNNHVSFNIKGFNTYRDTKKCNLSSKKAVCFNIIRKDNEVKESSVNSIVNSSVNSKETNMLAKTAKSNIHSDNDKNKIDLSQKIGYFSKKIRNNKKHNTHINANYKSLEENNKTDANFLTLKRFSKDSVIYSISNILDIKEDSTVEMLDHNNNELNFEDMKKANSSFYFRNYFNTKSNSNLDNMELRDLSNAIDNNMSHNDVSNDNDLNGSFNTISTKKIDFNYNNDIQLSDYDEEIKENIYKSEQGKENFFHSNNSRINNNINYSNNNSSNKKCIDKSTPFFGIHRQLNYNQKSRILNNNINTINNHSNQKPKSIDSTIKYYKLNNININFNSKIFSKSISVEDINKENSNSQVYYRLINKNKINTANKRVSFFNLNSSEDLSEPNAIEYKENKETDEINSNNNDVVVESNSDSNKNDNDKLERLIINFDARKINNFEEVLDKISYTNNKNSKVKNNIKNSDNTKYTTNITSNKEDKKIDIICKISNKNQKKIFLFNNINSKLNANNKSSSLTLNNNNDNISKNTSKKGSILKIKSKSILICDDSEILLNNLEKILLSIPSIKKNYSIIKVNDGFEILNKIFNDLKTEIKLVLTDECMNYINGSEAISIIKKAEENNKIKKERIFVSLTSYDDINITKFLESKGFDKILVKPIAKNCLEKFLKENYFI